MANKWNVTRDYYGKKRKFKPMKVTVRQWLAHGYYLVSFEDAEKLKEKYIMQGMQLYHERYEVSN